MSFSGGEGGWIAYSQICPSWWSLFKVSLGNPPSQLELSNQQFALVCGFTESVLRHLVGYRPRVKDLTRENGNVGPSTTGLGMADAIASNVNSPVRVRRQTVSGGLGCGLMVTASFAGL